MIPERDDERPEVKEPPSVNAPSSSGNSDSSSKRNASLFPDMESMESDSFNRFEGWGPVLLLMGLDEVNIEFPATEYETDTGPPDDRLGDICPPPLDVLMDEDEELKRGPFIVFINSDAFDTYEYTVTTFEPLIVIITIRMILNPSGGSPVDPSVATSFLSTFQKKE